MTTTAGTPRGGLDKANGLSRTSAGMDDPFFDNGIARKTQPSPSSFSHVNSESLNLSASSSPAQAKWAIERQLSETGRQLDQAAVVKGTLVQQREDLEARLQEINTHKHEAELPADLQKNLVRLEQEYHDVGRQTARALLMSCPRDANNDDRPGESSPAVFSSHRDTSPSKVSLPAWKQRNQQPSRAGDVQFAADISSSLLVQVRQLQTALAERDESLKSAMAEKVKLEKDNEGYSQRLRTLDENEQRYKDENWNLETQTHEMMAAAQEAAHREKKLRGNLAAIMSEKTKLENELDDVRDSYGKLNEDHSAAQKTYDSELLALRKSLNTADHAQDSLQKKIDELTSQNRGLASLVTKRSHSQEDVIHHNQPVQQQDEIDVVATPESSPPPSPVKATPRHGALESETLKNSLQHAHRMIQNLKSNIHREKTEKIELKRMLQDARDEIEQPRTVSGGPGSGNKRHKTRADVLKKPTRPDMLGGSRRPRTDVELDEPDWEDQVCESSPSRLVSSSRNISRSKLVQANGGANNAYQATTDAESGFETAVERETTTESDDFQTGAESLAGDSTGESTETETEGLAGHKDTIRGIRPHLPPMGAGSRSSYLSTASTSADEDKSDSIRPISSQLPRYRLKIGRGSHARRSYNTPDATPQQFSGGPRDSPASMGSSPPAAEQNLFAELGELNGGGSEFSTPGRGSLLSLRSTPATTFSNNRQGSTAIGSEVLPESRSATNVAVMVESGTMTEPWEPKPSPDQAISVRVDKAVSPIRWNPPSPISPEEHDIFLPSASNFPLPPSITPSPSKSDVQQTPLRNMPESPLRSGQNFITPPKTIWDEAQDLEASGRSKQEDISSPRSISDIRRHSNPDELSPRYSGIPIKEPPSINAVSLSFSSIMTQEIVPLEPSVPLERSRPATLPPKSSSPEAISKENSVPHLAPVAGSTGFGFLSGVTAAFGLDTARRPGTAIRDGELDQGNDQETVNSVPNEGVSHSNETDAAIADGLRRPDSMALPGVSVEMSDQGSQTVVTAQQIDDALSEAGSKPLRLAQSTQPAQLPGIMQASPTRSTASSRRFPPVTRARMPNTDSDNPSTSPLKRNSSAASGLQPGAAVNDASHPPLPPDHQDVITKARGRLSLAPIEQPLRPESASPSKAIGPPPAPTSFYRRPRTPADQSVSSPTHGSATPRAGELNQLKAGSHRSRRSSISSFASELDERFNIRADGLPVNRGFDAGPGTDPRMIQAITQTMIGEFLWKYIRRAGRGELSNTRHRRYFWVHPYTRTLYWSLQDPQAAGAKELKAKSVAIESVRAVVDDNHMPPGLHNRSLEVVTPGRRIKFTAGTSHRHETWFNALSYLLVRSQEENASSKNDRDARTATDAQGTDSGDGGDTSLTAADVDEFNPGSYPQNSQARPDNLSRASRSTCQSQVITMTGRNYAQPQETYLQPMLHSDRSATLRRESATITNQRSSPDKMTSTTHGISRTPTPHERSGSPEKRDAMIRPGSISRFSNMFRPASIRNSLSIKHHSRQGRGSGSISTVSTARATGPPAATASTGDTARARPVGGSTHHNNGSIIGHDDSAAEAGKSVVRRRGSDSKSRKSIRSMRSNRSSGEELRREMLRQENEGLGRLENVRACCDGR